MLEYYTGDALPYASEQVPGIGGRLRATPEQFEVEEIPLYEASGEGEHFYVNITKVGQTTKAVQADLARLFGIEKSQIGFAGLKDKNARTSQTFSLAVGRQDSDFASASATRIEAELPVQVNWATFHTNKLKTGHLLGNRFSIVVSQPECEVDECLARCDAIQQTLGQRGVPNYFGPQRFGQNGGNVRQGLGILDGSVRQRDKWLRQFLVGSVQSYLCNEYLALRMRRGLFDRLLAGDVAKKYETGGMFAVEDVAAEQDRYQSHEISFTAPIFGPKMWAAQGDSGELEREILEAASVSIEDFKKARVSGTRRLGRLLVDDLTITAHENGVRLSFRLPKGAYATTVMREFMKSEGESELADDGETGDE
jgi:tRNA pseudouridine13 synthase